jgi:hypothetical protein
LYWSWAGGAGFDKCVAIPVKHFDADDGYREKLLHPSKLAIKENY